MFDDLLRALKQFEQGVKVPVEIPLDDNGQFDRCCPAEVCGSEFRISFDDWKDKVRDEVVFCPNCRHEAPSDSWNTPAQSEYYRQVGMAHLQRVVGKALRTDSQRFNTRQPRGGFIQMSMSYRPGSPPIVLPLEAGEVLRQHFTCEACACRYSSLGAAFFCPSCGHNSASSTFQNALQTVRKSVEHLGSIKQALRGVESDDTAVDAARQILENGAVKIVAAFQRLAEVLFSMPASLTGGPRFPGS